MKPIDCRVQDWPRYFNHGWMMYQGREIVQIHTFDNAFYISRNKDGSFDTEVDINDLEPFYPEGKCINVYDLGICMARKARQVARRTASTIHYDITWQPRPPRLVTDHTIMWELCTVNKWPTYEEGLVILDKQQSVAISPTLILTKGKNNAINLYWGSVYVGSVTNDIYVPEDESSCFTKLARGSLQEVNFPCL